MRLTYQDGGDDFTQYLNTLLRGFQEGGDVMSIQEAYDPQYPGSLLDVGPHTDQDARQAVPPGMIHFPNLGWSGEGGTKIIEEDGTFFVVPTGINAFPGAHYGGFQTEEQALIYEKGLPFQEGGEVPDNFDPKVVPEERAIFGPEDIILPTAKYFQPDPGSYRAWLKHKKKYKHAKRGYYEV